MISLRNCCHRLFKWHSEPELIKELDGESSRDALDTTAASLSPAGLVDTFPPAPLNPNFALAVHRDRACPESESIRSVLSDGFQTRLSDEFFSVFREFARPSHKFKEFSEGEVSGAEQFAANLPNADGTNTNILVQRYRTKFSAQFCMFASLNQMVNLYPAIEETEVLHFEAHPDAIYVVERSRTRRVMMFSPRQMVTVRVVRQLDEGRFLDLSRSVEKTELAAVPSIAALVSRIDRSELASVFVAGSYFQNGNDGLCECVSLTKVDFLSSVSLKLAAFFLNVRFTELVKLLSQNLVRNSERSHPGGFENVVWFRDPEKEEPRTPDFATDRGSMLASRVERHI